MIQTIRKAWGIPELRKKIVFTLLILLIFRIGNAITVPYVNVDALKAQLDVMGATILGLYNVMSGGAFATATVFALSIQPYINSSIIIQLLTVAIPALERLAKDGGEEGKKKIQSITRYTTVAIAILQALGYYFMMKRYNLLAPGAEGVWPALVIIVTMIAGSSFVMWMGEQVTEFGVGNGISIILFAGILSRVPTMISGMMDGIKTWSSVRSGDLTLETLTAAGYSTERADRGLVPHRGYFVVRENHIRAPNVRLDRASRYRRLDLLTRNEPSSVTVKDRLTPGFSEPRRREDLHRQVRA